MTTNNANIAAHLPAVAAQHPDTLSVVVQETRGGRLGYRQYTAKELNAESDHIAHGLEHVGITRGMRTVLMVKPSLEFFALTFALFKVGAVPVMVDPGMGIKNLKTCLAEAEPEAFIGIPKAHVARVLMGWGKATVRILITVGRKLFWGGVTLQEIREEGDRPYAMAQTEPEETAAILFTSGSTGVPKGAVYPHRIFNAQVECLRRDYGIGPGEKDLATFPLFALFGPALGMAAIVPEMDASKPAKADPKKIIAAIQGYEATNMFGSPALIDVVGRYGPAHRVRLPSLKRVISAGAPADPESLARFCTMLEPGVEVLPSYGATEALPVAFIGTNELLGETTEQTHRGAGICVGRAVENMEVSIMAISDGPVETYTDDLRLPAGAIGEIVVKGPVVTASYYNRPESTALAKMRGPDGTGTYHRMGDLGYLDELGRLWMCGRKAHRVDTPEGTLFTIPCERIFNVHPSVRRTALVGVKQGGVTAPVLCVERNKDAREPDQTLRQALLELGQANPKTKSIRTILFHPRFPVDIRHNAKIFREKLAVWAEGKLS